MPKELDPVQYEIYSHRLFNILEEGRIAIQMVSGSPVVIEGGETMCALYAADGTPVLIAAGILLHCMGAWDFIKKTIEWYQDEPGILDGDQFFFNDPYIGGHHLADQVVLKPIFHEGRRIAWAASIMHTPDTGGIEPGGATASATELFHEGIKILGLKIVQQNKFRPEVFRTIVNQTRDPHLVGLDTKAKIAANNVVAKSFKRLVEGYGIDFVEQANREIIADSEAMSRAKLRRIPDGVWRSRQHGDMGGLMERPFRVVCTLKKQGEEITFDFTGSSPQNPGSINDTFSGTWSSLIGAIASQLFWEVPWNGGMFKPVHLVAPEGTVANCKYPAACSLGVMTVGDMVTQTALECIAKMLYSAGMHKDVNSCWISGHDNLYFGGVNQYGNIFGGVILDTFAGGCGATPERDGVHTGGHMKNPQSNIADVEILELNMPFLSLARRNAADSGGFGKFAGGMGGESAYLVYGADKLKLGFAGVGRKAPGGDGIFGGYPPGLLEHRFARNSNIKELFGRGLSPNSIEKAGELQGEVFDMPSCFAPIPMKNYDLLVFYWCAGSGYGDPLDRDPHLVLKDVSASIISLDTAKKIYGVVIDKDSRKVDLKATEKSRQQMRRERLKEAKALKGAAPRVKKSRSKK